MRRKEQISANPDIAIVGMAGMFPGAHNLDVFWQNIIHKVNTIREVSKSRWDVDAMFDPGLRRRDKIYSKWGGFLDDIPFDPTEYGIVPKSIQYIEAMQILALKIAALAFKDADMDSKSMPTKRTAVIFGSGGMHDKCIDYIFRTMLLHYLQRLESIPDSTKTDIADALCDVLPEWSEDSFPGMLSNVISGRISNRFDLKGTNFTVDAACASSLAALDVGIAKLRSGQADTALVGAVDITDNVMGFTAFAKTLVLSPRGKSLPFDNGADGIVISEGAAALVLKRLNDAENNGDRIHAVIKGIGSSSDGRNRSLIAPHPQGQTIALKRALNDAGIDDPGSVTLIEAHGTGTVAGDKSEMKALNLIFGQNGRKCAVGSVKSNIGHTKAAAGLAGILKGILALENKILPPTMGVDKPNSRIDFDKSAFYLNTEPRPWFALDTQKPRRCGVSSFGFGGTNFHAVLEEYTGGKNKAKTAHPSREVQIFTFISENFSGLADQLDDFLKRLKNPDYTDPGALAHALYLQSSIFKSPPRAGRLIVVADSVKALQQKLTRILPQLRSGVTAPEEPGVYCGDNSDVSGKVCFLFPGQGSQRINMLRDLLLTFPEHQTLFEQADSLLTGWFKCPLSERIYPLPTFDSEELRTRQDRLNDTRTAQPALAAVNLMAHDLLRNFGITPDFTAGHSFGEYIALAAADVIKRPDVIRLAALRGRLSREAAVGNNGGMAALQADAATVTALLKEAGTSAETANFNAPLQTVIGGAGPDIDICLDLARKKGVKAVRIPVTAAFHTQAMQSVADKLAKELKKVPFFRAVLPVYSNTTAGPYPKTPKAIRNRLARHICKPLDFVSQINNLYNAGASIFIEVGPGRVLCGLVGRILDKKPHTTLSLDYPGRSGTCQMAHLLAASGAAGLPVDLAPWFGSSKPNLETVFKKAARLADPPPMTWRISNGKIEPWHSTRPVSGNPSGVQPAVSGNKIVKKPMPQSSIPKSDVKINKKEKGVMDLKNSHQEPNNVAPVSDSLISRIQTNLDHFIELQRDQQRLMDRFLDMQQQLMNAAINGAGSVPEKLLRNKEQENEPSVAVRPSTNPAGIPPAPVLPRLTPIFSAPASAVPESSAPRMPPSAPTSIPAPVSEGPVSTQQFKADLLKVVSEQTGYPEDMLELDAHLEADLGIDSIKRVEIFGLLNDHHLFLETNDEELVLEELADLKSLQKIITWYDTNRTRLMQEETPDLKKA